MEEQKLLIRGGKRLEGEIAVQGAKNSALPLLAAAALCEGETVLQGCPRLSDVFSACRILTQLGCRCHVDGHTVTVKNDGLTSTEIPDSLMREMRSSIIFLGAVLGRTGNCSLSLPGGCELGPRPITLHLDALRRMGVTITETYGAMLAQAEHGIRGARITLPFPSVGATENIMLAAARSTGETVIANAAREPEIVDLATFLRQCGADIRGAGESTIVIRGVQKLQGTVYTVMPDRIAAVTYLTAAAVTGGAVTICGTAPQHYEAVTEVLTQTGCSVYANGSRVYLRAPARLRAAKAIRTMPYPGFPTDAQAILMALMCRARGTCVFEETMFESRYKHVDDLLRMGADIQVSGRAAVVRGVPKLYGAKVRATDLRGGAALLLAGLSAEGETELTALQHLDRGYEKAEAVLTALGAEIRRIHS